MSFEIDLLFDAVIDAEAKNLILAHCAYLAKFIPRDAKLASEYNYQLLSGLVSDFVEDSELMRLETIEFETIKKQKKLSSRPLYAFFCSYAKVPLEEQEIARLLQLNVILAVYSLKRRTGFDKVILRAINSVRVIFSHKNKYDLLSLLPKKCNFSAEYFRKKSQAKWGPFYHFGAIAALIESYESNEPFYKERIVRRKTKPPQISDNADFTTKKSTIEFDEDESRYEEIHAFRLVKERDQDAQIESSIDDKTAKSYYEFSLIAPSEIKQSLRLQSQLTKQIAASIERREKRLATEYRNLTQYELRLLVKECIDNLATNSAYNVLLLSLFLGRTIDDIVNAISTKTLQKANDNGPLKDHVVMHYEPELPKHEVAPKLEALLNRPSGEVLLIMPNWFTPSATKAMQIIQDSQDFKERASDCIHKINRKYNTRISLAKLSGVMSFYLHKSGADAAEIAFLSNQSVAQEPRCFYYQVDVQRLVNLHQTFISEMCTESPYASSVFTKTSELTVGSELQIEQEKLCKLFKLMQNSLLNLSKNTAATINDFHNKLTLYTLFILNISTGHRPVKDPYHSIHCFDFNAKTLFISDKETRSTLSGRVIKIPNTALSQMKHYLHHLHLTQIYLGNINAKNREAIKSALNGTGPLFLAIQNGLMMPMTPALMSELTNDILPLPLNWNRHFMRTYLRKKVKSYLVDAWMGHVGTEGDPLSKYSGLAMNDLQKIAEVIEMLLREKLKVKPIASFEANG